MELGELPVLDTNPLPASPDVPQDNFDPNRAVPVSVKDDDFNPDRAVPHDQDIAAQATDFLTKVRAGEVQADPQHIFQAELTAQAGKSQMRRFWDKSMAAGAGLGDAAKKAVGGIEDYYENTFVPQEKAYQALPWYQKIIQAPVRTLKGLRDLTVGGFNAAAETIPTAVDLATSIEDLPISPQGAAGAATGLLLPKETSDQEALHATLADIIRGGVSDAKSKINKVTGADPNSLGAHVAENAVPLLTIPGAGVSTAGALDTVAGKIVGATEKAGAMADKAVAKTASVAGLFGPSAARAGVGAALGGTFNHELVGALLGAATGHVRAEGRALQSLIDSKFEDVVANAGHVLNAPDGVPAFQAIKDAVGKETERAQAAVDRLTERMSPEDMKDAIDPNLDLADLTGPAKRVRQKMEDLKDLKSKLGVLESRRNADRFIYDSERYLTNLGLHTALGGAIGAGFSGATSATGDTSTMGGGTLYGLILGAAGSPFASREGIKENRITEGRNGFAAIGAQRIPTPDHPEYEAFQEAMGTMDDKAKTDLNVFNGFAAPLDTRIIPLTPDRLLAKASEEASDDQGGGMPPTEGSSAPSGFVGKDGNIYINSETWQDTGVAGHEVTHVLEEGLGSAAVKTLGDITTRMSDPKASPHYQAMAGLYLDAVRKSLANHAPLPDGHIASEALAEVGRIVLQDTPPELFWGGEHGGDIVKRKLHELASKVAPSWYNKLSVDPVFGTPYTRSDIQGMKKAFSDLGEQRGVSGQPEPNQNDSTGLPGGSTGVQVNTSNAVDALVTLGTNKTEARRQIQEALQAHSDAGKPPTVESLVKTALNKGKLSLMPNVEREPAKVPERFYIDRRGLVIDRLTGKDVDHFSPDNEQGHETPQELADSYNNDNYPLPPGWTGSHPDAWIPEWGVDPYPDKKGVWGISGEPQRQGFGKPDKRDLHGEYPTREAAEEARQQMLADLYKAESKTETNPARLLGDLSEVVSPEEQSLREARLGTNVLPNGLTSEENTRYQEIKNNPEPTTEDADEFSKLNDKIIAHMETRQRPQDAEDFAFMPSPHPDAIKSAAVRWDDGSITTGLTHGDAYINKFPGAAKGHAPIVSGYKEGFLANSGEFLDRNEALNRATKLGQLSPSSAEWMKKNAGSLEADSFERKKQFMPAPEKLQRMADQYGLQYAGEMMGKLHLFNDPTTKSTIAVKIDATPADLQAKLKASRDMFRGGIDAMPAPDRDLTAVVKDYTQRAGLRYVPHEGYAPLDEAYSKSIADRYEKLQHSPKDPATLKAYDAFRDGILGQYQTLLDHGYKIEPWPNEGQPYANSKDMLKDLRENKHLYYFKTEQGYGDKGGSTPENHPMLRGSGISFNGEEAPINDIFRGVHDALGHGLMGYQFGPRGEYNAFLAHASTLPPESHQALATETIGQNSWTNFGPHMRDAEGNIIQKGQPGYVELPDRPYTEQRAALLNFMPDTIIDHEVQGTNSRAVSPEEFASLRSLGQSKLDEFKQAQSPTIGLDKNWSSIRNQAWNEAQKDWGGIAIDTHTGKPLLGPIGKGGDVGKGPFGVTAKEPGQQTIEIPENASRAEFDRAMDQARQSFPQLEYQNYHLSIFHDNNKGTIDIDPTVIVPTASDAEAVGAYTHAIGGAYDFDSGNGLYPPHVKSSALMPALPVQQDGTSKAWVGPNGDIIPLKGWHADYLRSHPDVTESWGIDNPQDLKHDMDKDVGIQAGAARVNISKGQMTVEATEKSWPKIRDSVMNLALQNADHGVMGLTVKLFDDGVKKVVSSDSAKIDADPKKVADMPIFQGEKPSGMAQNLEEKTGLAGADIGGFGIPQGDAENYFGKSNQFMPSSNYTDQDVRRAVGGARVTKGIQYIESKGKNGQWSVFVPTQDKALITGSPVQIVQWSNRQVDSARTKLPKDYYMPGRNTQFMPLPEALPIEANDKGKVIGVPYALDKTPLAQEAGKGLKGEARAQSVANAYADRLQGFYDSIKDQPEIMAGKGWYSVFRDKVASKLPPEDAQLFGQLLAATSPNTAVRDNFKTAVEAYNMFKQGKFDRHIEGYLDAIDKMGDGIDEGKLRHHLDKNDLIPVKENGKKFGMNSQRVLSAMAGKLYEQNPKALKMLQFARNLTGEDFNATIDMWAARTVRRLGFEGTEGPWRIQPKSEIGVKPNDFKTAQDAFRVAADRLNMEPEDLQAILWFAEKDLWDKNNWTKHAGRAKSDFHSLLDKTDITPEGLINAKIE
jgi:hypothetical protein